jgi:hypothetical protein
MAGRKFHIQKLLQPPATSSLLGPNILLSNLSSNNQVSHPYKTASKIIVFYNLIFKFLERRWEDKII